MLGMLSISSLCKKSPFKTRHDFFKRIDSGSPARDNAVTDVCKVSDKLRKLCR